MTKQERATAELQAIMELLQEFGKKYGYSYVNTAFIDGHVSAWTPHNEPDRIELYIWEEGVA